MDSFDYHAAVYLLKPVSFRRFMQAIDKLQVYAQQFFSGTTSQESTRQDFFVKNGKKIHRIAQASILYMEAAKKYSAIHTEKGKILVYKRIKEWRLFSPIHLSEYTIPAL